MGVGKILKKKQRLEAGVDPWSVLKNFYNSYSCKMPELLVKSRNKQECNL
jgi:hypothetical protein